MLWQALASVRDLRRLHDIASVLLRYGFGDAVRRLGLADTLERAGRALHWQDAEEYAHLPPPARVRRAMEELGPTFVKLGQVLATRVDLFEPEWIAEFSRLHDNSLPVPYESVRGQLAEDLGAPPQEVFAEFDPTPTATGSLAQVHRARLPDGTDVIVRCGGPASVRSWRRTCACWRAWPRWPKRRTRPCVPSGHARWCANSPAPCAANSISPPRRATGGAWPTTLPATVTPTARHRSWTQRVCRFRRRR